ncbi:MAG: hypothetical protein HWN51_01695, partial [Desulfobacterales bacterium]|nr:hypothetical protein [Desulfobacterales bacterium]
MPGERTLYWTYKEEDAVREGNWKLLVTESKVPELYDLSNDPDEKDNLAGEHPERVDRMRKMMQQWKQTAKSQQTSTNNSGKKYSTPNHYGY